MRRRKKVLGNRLGIDLAMSPEHSVELEKVGKVMQMGPLNKEYSYVKSLCRTVSPLHKVAKIISPVPIMCLLALTFSESLHQMGAIYVGSTLGSIVIFPLFTTRYNKCHFFFFSKCTWCFIEQ